MEQVVSYQFNLINSIKMSTTTSLFDFAIADPTMTPKLAKDLAIAINTIILAYCRAPIAFESFGTPEFTLLRI
jgi:hypothetical protein